MCSLPLRVGAQGAAASVVARGVAATVALVRLGAECRGDCPGSPPGAKASPASPDRGAPGHGPGRSPCLAPAWWRSTRPTWEVPGATGAWQSVFRARSGAVEPLSKLSLGSCVEVAWCGRKWYLTWKPRRCCRSCTNACNVAPSSARTPLPATRASQRGATSTGLWTTARRSAIGKGATSTAWRASGVISSGVWQPKGESAENGCPSILLSMSGATIIGVCWDQNRLRHCSSCFKANPVAKTGLYPRIFDSLVKTRFEEVPAI